MQFVKHEEKIFVFHWEIHKTVIHSVTLLQYHNPTEVIIQIRNCSLDIFDSIDTSCCKFMYHRRGFHSLGETYTTSESRSFFVFSEHQELEHPQTTCQEYPLVEISPKINSLLIFLFVTDLLLVFSFEDVLILNNNLCNEWWKYKGSLFEKSSNFTLKLKNTFLIFHSFTLFLSVDSSCSNHFVYLLESLGFTFYKKEHSLCLESIPTLLLEVYNKIEHRQYFFTLSQTKLLEPQSSVWEKTTK